jgi:hypothetical protein
MSGRGENLSSGDGLSSEACLVRALDRAMAGRQAKNRKPNSPTKAATITLIAMHRIIAITSIGLRHANAAIPSELSPPQNLGPNMNPSQSRMGQILSTSARAVVRLVLVRNRSATQSFL